MITSTIIASLLGLLGSSLPKIFEYFTNKQKSKDLLIMNEHELKMYALQTERAAATAEQAIRALDAEYIGKSNVELYKFAVPTTGWTAQLSESVRPVITYIFTFLFVMKVMVTLFYVIGLDLHGKEATALTVLGTLFKAMGTVVWDPETRDLYATIVMFWFGDRTLTRKK